MTGPSPTPVTNTTFTPRQLAVLKALRARYREDGDRFSDWEMAQLRFLRWRHQHGDPADRVDDDAA